MRELILRCLESASSREELWASFLAASGCRRVAEIGVWKGDFAAHLLRCCPEIDHYYAIDPWRPLTLWNKPLNVDRETFEAAYREALEKTGFAGERLEVLRGTTTEVVDRIPDGSLDFVYVDGDHTLRGIAIDLIRALPKVKPGGFVAGDDFCPSIWQHGPEFEPTLVFPYAVYFAEASAAPIVALPWDQFLLQKSAPGEGGFSFEDLTGAFGEPSVGRQVRPPDRPRPGLGEKVRRRARRLLGRPVRR